MTVASWPPPGPPVETNTPADLPYSLPCCQRLPVPSQKAYKCVFQPDKNKTKGNIIYTYLELSGHATIASGDTKNETVVVSEVAGLYDGIVGLGGRMHLGQDFLGESLGNPKIRSIRSDIGSSRTYMRGALTDRW